MTIIPQTALNDRPYRRKGRIERTEITQLKRKTESSVVNGGLWKNQIDFTVCTYFFEMPQ